jgi:nicotinamidase/pyrazinamidase
MMAVQPDKVLREGDALLVVDVQTDFCPGGKLAVERGDEVIPVLNEWIRAATGARVPVYASRDWHPPHHVSFYDQGGAWPPHCVQDTPGAAYHPALELPDEAIRISKGVRLDRDQYSAFDSTGLGEHLRSRGIRRLFVGGLAQDVCVRATVLSAVDENFEVHLIPDATRPVSPREGERALQDMQRAGAVLQTSEAA